MDSNVQKELLKTYFPKLSEQQVGLYRELETSYANWNKELNLISRKDFVHFAERHLLHSLSLARCFSLRAQTRVVDLGTGGGLPALPLAIFFPQTQFTLVDATKKKLHAVASIAEQLSLSNVRCTHARIEDLEGRYDLAIGRAVVPLPRLLGWLDRVAQRQGKPLASALCYWTGPVSLPRPLSRYTIYSLQDIYRESWFSTKKLIYVFLDS